MNLRKFAHDGKPVTAFASVQTALPHGGGNTVKLWEFETGASAQLGLARRAKRHTRDGNCRDRQRRWTLYLLSCLESLTDLSMCAAFRF